MAIAYNFIASSIVGSGGVASVTFSSIPATYTDLKLVCSLRVSASGVQNINLNFNGLFTNLSERYLLGSGASASSGSQTAGQIGIVSGTAVTANTFNNTELYIPNYTSANYKSFSTEDVSENNAATAYASMWAGLWSSTAAITSLTLTPGSGNWVQYSTFYLYGINKS